MDDRIGNFREITEEKFEKQMEEESPLVFKEGEILEIRGSRLRIEKIQRKKLILKLLPALDGPSRLANALSGEYK